MAKLVNVTTKDNETMTEPDPDKLASEPLSDSQVGELMYAALKELVGKTGSERLFVLMALPARGTHGDAVTASNIDNADLSLFLQFIAEVVNADDGEGELRSYPAGEDR